MDHTDKTLRHPETITNMEQLRQAKKKAEVNATQDKLRLENNINQIKREGPKVLLTDVILPIVGVGVAIYGITKLVQTLTDEDRGRDFYAEPEYEYEESVPPVHYRNSGAAYGGRQRSSSLFTTANLIKFAPLALQAARYGADYLEKNGTPLPEIVTKLLHSTGNGAESSES